ncbi:DUF2225 domain-containing protein [Calidifontibacillus erzurumensis]|uniref:DUF2225 domain-containing protein n=1 Tax=Calidifontibacillus erzurumensis TaxID=2741433 RepID=UPI0035B54196
MTEVKIPPLYDKKETCPLCQTAFTTKKIRTRFIKLEHTDTDFCPTYKDETISPLLYFVKVCPSCGYSYTDHFSPYFAEGTKETLLQSVSAKWVPQNFGEERTIPKAIQTYKLALYCASLKKERAIVIANLLLRLTWLYRKINNGEEEKRFMMLALDYLNAAYSDANYGNSNLTEIHVLYLIGEYHKRLGHYEEAISTFAKVVDMKNRVLDTKIINFAREQWYATRNAMKQA